jgi:hypothetical protein
LRLEDDLVDRLLHVALIELPAVVFRVTLTITRDGAVTDR